MALLAGHKAQDFNATYRPLPSNTEKARAIRAMGAKPLGLDLSSKTDLRRIAAISKQIIWMAPPNPAIGNDFSLARLALYCSAFSKFGDGKACISYISTTGVYGSSQGRWLDEFSPVNPDSNRAKKRVAAENLLKMGFKAGFIHARISRAPGIYGNQRLPVERLQKGTPALQNDEDSYSNHIHELDLARIARLALYRGKPWEVINAVDEEPMKMGDYFDMVADHFGLNRPQRLPASEIKGLVSPMMWSFMKESRRIRSTKLAKLNIRLKYPSVRDFLSTLNQANS